MGDFGSLGTTSSWIVPSHSLPDGDQAKERSRLYKEIFLFKEVYFYKNTLIFCILRELRVRCHHCGGVI